MKPRLALNMRKEAEEQQKMVLIREDTEEEVKIGDKVKTNDGVEHTINAIIKPHKPSSTGRILISRNYGMGGLVFPSVCGLKWKENN